MSANIAGIYATLDVLLDTRLGTIARMSEDLAVSVLQSGYHNRFDDEFPGVDMVEFKKLYEARDVETLKMSVKTGCVNLIRDLMNGVAEQAFTRPYHQGANLVVNLYPYVLDEEEQQALAEVLRNQMNNLCSIEFVYLTQREVTPNLCKTSFAAMFVYEHDNWLDMHIDSFRTTQLAELDMFAPALFRERPSASEMEKRMKEVGHPFKAIEKMASPLIKLQLLDSSIFSVVKN
jgi:hypothetical protein